MINIFKLIIRIKNSLIRYRNSRQAFSLYELINLIKAGLYFYIFRIDPLYQSKYEEEFTNSFTKYMGGGFTDAVNSGTNACYISLKALNLKKGSKVAVSCFTDPGVLNAIIIAELKPVLIPFQSVNDWRHDKKEFLNICNLEDIKAVILVHTFGEIIDLYEYQKICNKKNIFLIEDISQCIGGKYREIPVGSFSDISFSSTMGRKGLITGSVGGLIHTKSKDLFKRVLSYADRGKYINEYLKISKDASLNKYISLNFSADEFLCSIGISSLRRIDKTNNKRRKVLTKFIHYFDLYNITKIIQIIPFDKESAPFVGVINIKDDELKKRKLEFKMFIEERSIPINTQYIQIAPLWKFLDIYISDNYLVNKSKKWSNNHLILYLHEGYKDAYIKRIVRQLADIFKRMNLKF